MDKNEVLALCKEKDVAFVRLQFTDIFGCLKNVAIPLGQLEKALDGELMFDGSSIEGFVRIEESDMYLMPDPETFLVLPWRPQQGAVARLICDVYNPDGTPFAGCPRNNLKKTIAEAEAMGFTMNVGPEAEFFLFNTDAEGRPTMEIHDKAGYFDMTPNDHGEDARRDLVLVLEQLGFEIEASHHEVAYGQHEIDFKYGDALTTADRIMTFRYVVRTIAQRAGLHATFMPKPVFGINGSGMHCNQSLFTAEENAFFDPSDELKLSRVAYNYIGGIVEHARAMTAITNPIINSYKRLVPGYEAPVYVAWSTRNRSPLIRVPEKRGSSTRVELRNPDPACNPYLAISVMLQAGLDGIKRKLTPPEPTNKNIFIMNEQELADLGIQSLPGSLEEALQLMAQDELIKNALGSHIFGRYMEAKKQECDEYRMQVHQWEVDRYLTMF